jgi:two-component system chemotaxis response regulator CheY
MRALLSTVLARAGANQVRQAANGAEALALLSERPAALILADHMMPEMDGIALTKRVRANDSEARIIMITGRAEPCYAEAATAAGANAVLVKPVSPRALIEAIERAVA